MADYKFTQQSGSGWKVNTDDKADAYQDTNELRAIVDELGRLLGHSKKNGSFPEDLTSGGTLVSPTFTTSIATPIINLTGGQITFPAAQAPNAGANVLDDYEEGEWTPALKFGGNSVDMTGEFAGLYTKIGRVVTITGFIGLSAKGTSTGAATITGLPFTSKDSWGAYTAVSINFSNVTYANAFRSVLAKNSSTMTLGEITEAGVATDLTNADFANNSQIFIGVTYFTN